MIAFNLKSDKITIIYLILHREKRMPTLSFFSNAQFSVICILIASFVIFGCASQEDAGEASAQLKGDGLHRFMVIDPGHFHAALLFNRPSYEGISPDVKIYAPVDGDFNDHMARVIPFNNRAENPAQWKYHAYLADDYEAALYRERFGDIAILSGKNNKKIDTIKACIDSGYNVLSDKPWLIDPAKFDILKEVLDTADAKGLTAYDIMTERYEITSLLQRLLANEESVFGTVKKGSPDDPSVIKSSIHHLSKIVAGQQLKRSWWFFDTSIQGEGLVDITTHLVDLIFWILEPETPIDYTSDVEVTKSSHWPTVMSEEQFRTITYKDFPPQFELDKDGNYPYYCNGNINFALKGVNCKVEVVWNYVAPKGTGDTHYSIIKGTKAEILILQGKEQNFRPELYIQAANGVDAAEVGAVLKTYIGSLADGEFSGLEVIDEKGRWRIEVPASYRVGHEAHFGQVTSRFLEYLGGEAQPEWEKANMLAKYYVTTKGLEMCR